MGTRNQIIVVIAVFIATIAVAGNVFAFTRSVEQRAENHRNAATAPWAQPFEAATTTEAPPPDSSESDDRLDETSPQPSDEPAGDETNKSRKEECDKDKDTDSSDEPRNHGCEVSSAASDKDFKDGIDGPPGAVISEIARPDDKDTPPGQDKDKDKDKD